MRRRLWWALRLLDTRASEDFGADSALHEGMSDTLLPLNINDSDIASLRYLVIQVAPQGLNMNFGRNSVPNRG